MSEGGARPRRKIWKYLLSMLLGGLLLLLVAAWYMTTDSFQIWVRHRLVTELERITGGRVDLGSFHTIPFRLQVEVRDLTIHGLERPVEHFRGGDGEQEHHDEKEGPNGLPWWAFDQELVVIDAARELHLFGEEEQIAEQEEQDDNQGVRPFDSHLQGDALHQIGRATAATGCLRHGDGHELHVGVEREFAPAGKANPGLRAGDLDALAARIWDVDRADPAEIPGRRRFHCLDPFGNRLEFLE